MNVLRGYLRTLGQYLRSPKGKHDFFDDLRALAIVLGTGAGAAVLLWYVLEKL